MKAIFGGLAILVACQFAHSISERDYARSFNRNVKPFFANGVTGYFTGASDVRLFYRYFLNPQSRGSIVISEGFGQSTQAFSEVAYDWYQRGYSVFLFDHRGQGQSERVTADPQRGFLDDYEALPEDLHTFITRYVQPNSTGPLFLFGHSMGGAVAALYLELYPQVFSAAVLSAPMLKINLKGAPEWFVRPLMANLAMLDEDFYVTVPKNPENQQFETNGLTQSEERFRALIVDPIIAQPNLGLWGVTARWLHRALQMTQQILDDVRTIQTPILLFTAGQDRLVSPQGHVHFCQILRSLCQHVVIEEARHNVFDETDAIREQVMSATENFFNQHAFRRPLCGSFFTNNSLNIQQ